MENFNLLVNAIGKAQEAGVYNLSEVSAILQALNELGGKLKAEEEQKPTPKK